MVLDFSLMFKQKICMFKTKYVCATNVNMMFIDNVQINKYILIWVLSHLKSQVCVHIFVHYLLSYIHSKKCKRFRLNYSSININICKRNIGFIFASDVVLPKSQNRRLSLITKQLKKSHHALPKNTNVYSSRGLVSRIDISVHCKVIEGDESL